MTRWPGCASAWQRWEASRFRQLAQSLGLAAGGKPLGNLVYSADGSSVDTVIVDGNILVENGLIKTLDEKALLREVTPVAQRIAERPGVLDQGKLARPVE